MASKPKHDRPGNPGIEVTDKMRGEVEALTAAGYGQADVAAYLGISEPTLRNHFRTELDYAGMKLIGGAVAALGRMAVGSGAVFDDKGNKIRDEVKPELGAICFLLKTKGKRLGWSERLELTGNDGGPISVSDAATKLLDLLSRRDGAEGSAEGSSQLN